MENRTTQKSAPTSDTALVEKPITGMEGTVATSEPQKRSFQDYLRGDLGFIPVLITLVLITIYFQITTNGFFLEKDNISNLTLQIVTPGILGVAAVLVLLLGEIDLSLAAVAGAASAVTAVLSVYQDWNPWLAILAGLLTGTVIGLVNGFFIAVLRVPSFIVTLAGSIGYAGMLLVVLGKQSTLIIRDATIRSLGPTYLEPIFGIGLPVLGLVIYIAATLLEQRNRARASK